MTIIEQLEDADKTLAADGYKENSYVRLAISEAIRALRQPPVSGSLPSVDPLDDENSEIHKIGREIAEMSDEEFESNCKALEKMLKGSKGNDR